MKKKKQEVECVICGYPAEYLARYTEEPLCEQHAIIDEELNYHNGKIDRYGNEIKSEKNDKNN